MSAGNRYPKSPKPYPRVPGYQTSLRTLNPPKAYGLGDWGTGTAQNNFRVPAADTAQPLVDTDVGPAPCDRCDLAPRCAAELLACRQFLEYVDRNHWTAGPRTPTRESYGQAFGDEADPKPAPKRAPKAPRKRSAYVEQRLAGLTSEGQL